MASGLRVYYSVPFLVGLLPMQIRYSGPPSSGSVMMWMYNSDRSDSDNFGDESETSSLLP